MTRKSALYALAVAVLMGTMAVAALADDQDVNMSAPADPSVSAQPEQGVEAPDAGEIREPMETGAVPDRPEGSSDLNSNRSSDEPTAEFGGQTYRPEIDLGP